MAEKKTPVPTPDPAAEMRSKLINRLAVAGGLVASLLAVLAFFDYLATPPDEPEATVFSRPVPVAPKKELSQPVTQATNLPEPPAPLPEPEVKPAVEPPPPEVAATPAVVEEIRPSASEPRLARNKQATRKEAPTAESLAESRSPSRSTAARTFTLPSIPSALPAVPSVPAARVKLPEALSDVTSSPSMLPAESSAPSARVVQIQPAPAVMPPSIQRLFSGFSLQAGVFSSPQRAEELHARLTLSGVPSTLETRVQVGPFRTRQEAEAAQAKLRELGIGSVLVPPKGSKH